MALHTIKWQDSISKIYDNFQKSSRGHEGLKNYKDLWNHKVNKILRIYWPKGTKTDINEIPIGYSLYLPTSDPQSATIPKEQEKKTWVTKNKLEHLRLKINLYESFDHYMWSSYDWKSKFFREKLLTPTDVDKEIKRRNGVRWGACFPEHKTPWSEPVIRQTPTYMHFTDPPNEDYPDVKYFYFYDHVTNSIIPTTTPIQDFKVVSGETMEVPKSAKWGGVQGDNDSVKAMSDGYVYLFSRTPEEAACELSHTYRVKNGTYRELEISATDDSHNPNKKVGDDKSYIEIENFFNPSPEDKFNSEKYKEYYVYTSLIPLTWEVITKGEGCLLNTVSELGTLLPQASWLFTQRKSTPSGKQLHNAYQEDGETAAAVDVITYPFKLESPGTKNILVLNLPDIEKEAIRRNENYVQAHGKLIKWRDGDERSQKTFVFALVNYLYQNNKLKGDEINLETYHDYRFNESFNFRLKTLSTENAALELVAFLEDPRFQQVITNYSNRFTKDDDEALEDKLQELMYESHKDLGFSQNGAAFFKKAVANKKSYYNQLVKGIAKIGGDLPLELVHVDASKVKMDTLKVFRKTSALALLWIKEFIPAICVGLIEENRKTLINNMAKIMKVPTVRFVMPPGAYGRLVRVWGSGERVKYQNTIELLDIYKEPDLGNLDGHWSQEALIGRKKAINIKNGLGVASTFLEALNMALTVNQINSFKDMKLDEGLSLLGGFLDLAVNIVEDMQPVLLILAKNNQYVSSVLKFAEKKMAPPLAFISCVVDAYLATKDMFVALDNDEYMIASGRGLQAMGSFALGVVFLNQTMEALPFGASMMGDIVIGGVTIATCDIWMGVGLTMVIMGSIIVALWDTEAQDWVENCFLGTSPGKPLDLQVTEIIAWLTRFKVKGWFKLPHSRQIYQRAFTFELDTGRLISGASIITISHLRVMGKNRTLFDWTKQSKDEFDIVLGDIEFDLAEIIQENFSKRVNFVYNYSDKVCHYRQGLQYRAWCQVFIRKGKIETVQLNFEFDRDVDQVEATIVVNVMNSELQRRFSTPLRRQYKNKLGYSTAVDFSTI